jgi:hypothetical protein
LTTVVTLSGSRKRGSDRAGGEPCGSCPGRLAAAIERLVTFGRRLVGLSLLTYAATAATVGAWWQLRRPRYGEDRPSGIRLRVAPLSPAEHRDALERERAALGES